MPRVVSARITAWGRTGARCGHRQRRRGEALVRKLAPLFEREVLANAPARAWKGPLFPDSMTGQIHVGLDFGVDGEGFLMKGTRFTDRKSRMADPTDIPQHSRSMAGPSGIAQDAGAWENQCISESCAWRGAGCPSPCPPTNFFSRASDPMSSAFRNKM